MYAMQQNEQLQYQQRLKQQSLVQQAMLQQHQQQQTIYHAGLLAAMPQADALFQPFGFFEIMECCYGLLAEVTTREEF